MLYSCSCIHGQKKCVINFIVYDPVIEGIDIGTRRNN